MSWGANIPPTVDSCGGYRIKTRYVTSNACGDYPAGTSSDVTACKESPATTRIVDITQPLITCPASINVMADTAMSYATVSLPPPVYSDNCTPLADIMLEWTMSPPTAGSGSGIIPVPYLFNIGITTVNYIATDLCGHSRSCSFTVTVTPNDPPEIICPANLSASTDTGLCTAAISPGFPALISGPEPIVYTWIMTGATNDAGMGPIVPDPYPLALGTTTITWIASNISGSDTGEQVVEVIDNEPPQFETPGPFEFCVMSIDTASWNGLLEPNTDIVPDRPDYYILENGNTALDPDISTFIDNCCPSDSLTLAWTINFSTGHPPVSGTGLPSQSGPITLWGDTNYNIVFHTITYVLIDCHGNNSTIRTATITIKPRPKVDKIF